MKVREITKNKKDNSSNLTKIHKNEEVKRDNGGVLTSVGGYCCYRHKYVL